jgi:hypothetical protein
MEKLTIGKLAELAGVGVETVRFYQRKELLREPKAEGAFRIYRIDDAQRIIFIKKAQELGYTLVQVAINDLVLLVAFIPIVKFLLGVSNIEIPFDALLSSVVIFVVIPLAAGFISNRFLIKLKGEKWFRTVLK